MKKAILTIAALFTTICITAQNTDVKTEVKTTTKTVKDSKGEKKTVKTEEVNEVQKIEFKDPNSNTKEKEVLDTPADVTTKIKVTVDGVTREITKDYSGYYMYNGVKSKLILDKVGYSFIDPETKKRIATLRETSNGGFIVTGKKVSMGYFDQNGNLIIQSHDPKTDTVITEKAEIIKE
jgi:ABC-type Fe3+-hydroxamate transport system substrate-binding protein